MGEGRPLVNGQKSGARWYRISSGTHLQLSAVNPPDARVRGPVVGPDSRVRPCSGVLPESDEGVICLEVDGGGNIERGYTIRRMVALTPETATSGTRLARVLYAAIALVGMLATLFLIGR